MRFRTSGVLTVLTLVASSMTLAPATYAQTPPSEQGHGAHHPGGQTPGQTSNQAPVQPAAPAQGGMIGMMGKDGMMCGGDMQKMTSMMQDMHMMMSAQSGMMSSRVEARLAAMKTDLKLTDEQMPHWNRFAETLRRAAKSMDESHAMKMASGETATLPMRLGQAEKALVGHLNAVKEIGEALKPLYASLNEQQKKIADALRIGPMGMM